MKTVTYSIVGAVLAILLGIAAWFIFTSPPSPSGIDMRVCVDITDKDSLQLTSPSIMSIATNGESLSEEVNIQLQSLSNYHMNTVQKFELPNEAFLTGNSYRRKRNIHKLEQQLDTALGKLYAGQTDKSRSNIFLPLLKISNDLSQSKASRKILIANSDLQENSPLFSCFKASDIALLKKNSALIEQKLVEGNTINNLRGITLYIIHYPRNERDDELFNIMAEFYKRFYEKHGATVYIQSNLLRQ